MTGIEVSRNEFDGTEVSAVVVNLRLEWKSVCEEEVSIVGNVFDDVGVVDSEYLRDGAGNFITDGEGRESSPRRSCCCRFCSCSVFREAVKNPAACVPRCGFPYLCYNLLPVASGRGFGCRR